MSCSIDHRRGSILMEFVMVLPIYIFLFGAIFLIGEIGLNAIRISVGDRNLALDAGDRYGHSFSPFGLMQMGKEFENVRSTESRTYRADENFQGAWAWEAAGRAWFSYRLRSWGSAMVSYPFLRYNGSAAGGGDLANLVGGGAVVYHSKDFSLADKVRAYNYYTLKRTDLSRAREAYRNWKPNQLVESGTGGQYWDSGVYHEPFLYDEPFGDSIADKLDSSPPQGRDANPSPPEGRKEYARFGMFITWSQ